MRLVHWKWLEMIAKREVLRIARPETSAKQVEYTVRCECGFGREEADMVRGIVIKSGCAFVDSGEQMQCGCCDTWQHGHCYGFVARKPCDEHFCYRCVLENSDVDRLQGLKGLAKFRRAIWLAYQGEYPGSLAKFAKMLRQCPQFFYIRIDR